MDTIILVGVVAVIIIGVVSRHRQRSRIAAPILLVLIGIGLSFLPFMPEAEVEPDVILAVLLPALLFASAVNMPAMNFQREFTAISALAVALVLVSSIGMGFLFHALIPGLALPWCIAGIVTGRRRIRAFQAEQRISDRTMWRTVTLVLEGSVFLIMGLEINDLLDSLEDSPDAIFWIGGLLLISAVALAIMLLIRALCLLPLTCLLGLKAARYQARRLRVEAMREELTAHEARSSGSDRARRRAARTLSDIDYYLREPLTVRDAAVMVAAGMRGAVTVAAAQTLPADTPHRESLVLIAFTVALISLLVQGGTLGPLVLWLKPTRPDPVELERQRTP